MLCGSISSLTTTAALISGEAAENYLPPASFITAQGTPVIIALKRGCAWDMGTAMTSIENSGCIALMYDKNGTGLPNKFGSDIVGMGLSPIKQPLKIINGVKVMETVFFPQTGLTYSECTAEISKASEYTSLGFQTGITQCKYGNDRWAAAMKYCKEKGYHLPSEDESLKLVQGLFKNANGNHPAGTSGYSSYTFDTVLAESIGLKSNNGSSLTTSNVDVTFWLSNEENNLYAYTRTFYTTHAYVNHGDRAYTSRQAVCIGN